MKFWVTLEDREAEVEFHAEEGTLILEVEGRKIEADFRRLPDGEVYSLLIDGKSHEVRVSPVGTGVEVTHGGATLPVEVRHPLEKLLQRVQRAAGVAGFEAINAPMPGLVVSLKVKVGDRVAAGQAVAVIEAMKMQNELFARHGGVVEQVLVGERESVAAGAALIKIRPES